jgi:hypothetical protein
VELNELRLKGRSLRTVEATIQTRAMLAAAASIAQYQEHHPRLG